MFLQMLLYTISGIMRNWKIVCPDGFSHPARISYQKLRISYVVRATFLKTIWMPPRKAPSGRGLPRSGWGREIRNHPKFRVRARLSPSVSFADSSLSEGAIHAHLPFDVERTKARVLGGTAELLLDAQQLVVLGNALAAAGGAGLDLAGVQGNS